MFTPYNIMVQGETDNFQIGIGTQAIENLGMQCTGPLTQQQIAYQLGHLLDNDLIDTLSGSALEAHKKELANLSLKYIVNSQTFADENARNTAGLLYSVVLYRGKNYFKKGDYWSRFLGVGVAHNTSVAGINNAFAQAAVSTLPFFSEVIKQTAHKTSYIRAWLKSIRQAQTAA
jgi:hypothetical protein